MRLPVHELKAQVKELDLGDAKVYHLPNWDRMSHPERLTVIRQITEMRGRDPRIAKLAVNIIRRARVQPRDYKGQAAAILKWVQDPKNCYYVNEPGERLQDPIYTLQVGHADCDDMVALLCSLFESVRLPWRLVLSGKDSSGTKIRHIEGQRVPSGVDWVHIYCMVGAPPYRPNVWWFCEPTVVGVPLGWDVIDGDAEFLPEMKGYSGPMRILPAPRANLWNKLFKPPLPARENQSPAYDEFRPATAEDYGQGATLGPLIGAALSEAEEDGMTWDRALKTIFLPIAIGVSVSVLAGVLTPIVKKKLGVKN